MASHVEISMETPFNTFIQQLTRKYFDKAARHIVLSCSDAFNQFITETRQCDFVILGVGGANKISRLQHKQEKLFSDKIYQGFNV